MSNQSSNRPQTTTAIPPEPNTGLMKRVAGSLQKTIHGLHRKRTRLAAKADHKPDEHHPESELFQVQREQEIEDDELRDLKETVEREKRETHNIIAEENQLEQEILETRNQIDNLGTRLDDTTKSLTVAERFLSTADRLSQAEVVRAIEVINEEIFQLTSVVAEMVQVENKHPIEETDRATLMPLLNPIFHSSVLDIILPLQCVDITAIQLGWQAILVHWCCEVIKGWSIAENLRDMNAEFDEVYLGIHGKQPQSIAGRWRAITFGAMKKVSPVEQDEALAIVAKTLIALPLVCGYISNQSAHETVSAAFHQRMGPLFEKCLELSRVTHEGVVSVDIIPYLEPSGTEFKSACADLEYEDEEDIENGKSGVIAFTLNLGLCQRRKEGSMFQDPFDPILKAKVILVSTLEETIA